MTDMNTTTRPRRTPTVALLVAVGVLAVLLVQHILGSISSVVLWAGTPDALFAVMQGFPLWLITVGLPFSAGVFLAFWFILPITPALRWSQVVARSLAAAGVGVGIVLIASVMLAIASGFGLQGSVFGSSFPLSYDTRSLENGLRSGVYGAVTTFVNTIPLVVLAAFAGQYWMRRQPAARSEAAMIDEV